MKTCKLFFSLFFIFTIFSCSNDIETLVEDNETDNQEVVDEEDTQKEESADDEVIEEEEEQDNNVPITDEDSFNYTYDGNEVSINEWTGQKVENTLSILAAASDGNSIHLEFNTAGNLGKISSYSGTDFDFPSSGSFAYFSSNFIDFELINIDEENKKVQVEFSGKLYEDSYDIESNFHEVQGNFIVSYLETDPSIAQLGTQAVIDGKDWFGTSSLQNGGFLEDSDVTFIRLNDSENAISITVNHDTTTEGSYSFNTDSNLNSVKLLRYDAENHEFITYETSGTLVITEKTVGPQLSRIKGEFSFTATALDNSTKEITNGAFNLVYSTY
ncbi:DUF6252 family protein [Zobellia uliginosa]|uniref:DUF6252 family protein n=1 Tax=Zobellia uliginosa TaxID=143224 RepID=UPI001C070F87|nr:DUF6252 family protein [Zobellia uliginosa]MBU2946978.1 hypothetical protein [Zobellia uliginosa]